MIKYCASVVDVTGTNDDDNDDNDDGDNNKTMTLSPVTDTTQIITPATKIGKKNTYKLSIIICSELFKCI